MSCESDMEGLQNFAKQLEEQKATIAAQIQSIRCTTCTNKKFIYES